MTFVSELEPKALWGHFDQIFLPYYRADLDAGRLTPEQAKELFKYSWIKSTARTRGTHNGAHFCLGGQWADGSDATNELTTLILDAYREYNAPDPKLSVRVHNRTPDRLYRHYHNDQWVLCGRCQPERRTQIQWPEQ